MSTDASDSFAEVKDFLGRGGFNGGPCRDKVDSDTGNSHVNEPGINNVLLLLAMKERFREWSNLGRDVIGARRSVFISEVARTYYLFREIADRLSRR